MSNSYNSLNKQINNIIHFSLVVFLLIRFCTCVQYVYFDVKADVEGVNRIDSVIFNQFRKCLR